MTAAGLCASPSRSSTSALRALPSASSNSISMESPRKPGSVVRFAPSCAASEVTAAPRRLSNSGAGCCRRKPSEPIERIRGRTMTLFQPFDSGLSVLPHSHRTVRPWPSTEMLLGREDRHENGDEQHEEQRYDERLS